MKKNFKLAAWISGAIGALLMLIGIIAKLAGGILLGHMWSSYFYPGGVFVGLGIFLILCAMMERKCEHEKKE